MAIDYVIDYACPPKERFTTDGILERLKGAERARTIIELFRKNGDDRPPSQMGFEFTRSTPTGEEERRVIVVQDLLDEAGELDEMAHHCIGCPANRTGHAYGCTGFIQYPISAKAENWLLDRLPVPDEALVWLLLKQGVEEFKYDGSTVQPLRANEGIYFEAPFPTARRLGEFSLDANQLFEMIFAVGHINPNHAALILLFLRAIDRDLEADQIMKIAPPPADAATKHPFILEDDPDDDNSIHEIKGFLKALHMAWTLGLRVIVDA